MPISTRYSLPTERNTLLLRVTLAALLALAMLFPSTDLDWRQAALTVGYLALASLGAMASRRLWSWLIYLAAVVDVAAVTSFLALSPALIPIAWPLYVLPMAAASPGGPRAVVVSLAMAVGSVVGLSWIAPSEESTLVLWSLASLLAAALAVIFVSRRWPFERSRRLVWRDTVAAAERLWSGSDPDEAIESVLDAMVRLARAQHGWLWRLEEAGGPRLLRGIAPAPEPGAEADARNPASRAVRPKFGLGCPVRVDGDVTDIIALTHRGRKEALLALAWTSVPPDLTVRSACLRSLAPVAAAAILRAERWAVERSDYAAALKREDRLRATIGAFPAPIAVWDPSGSPVLGNSAYTELFGQVRPQEPSTPHPDEESEVCVGGPPRTYVVRSAQVAGTGDLLSLFVDVTHEREALKQKDDLIAMAGHELRSPLTSISGYSQMMARQLGAVQKQISQLDQLIGDFVEASSLGFGHLALDMQPLDMAELARSAAERFAGSNPGRILRLDMAPAAPVRGDAARLGQVLDNLLSNAAKYSTGEDKEIVLAVAGKEDHVLITVQDHGVGIDSEHLPLIFERFYRVQSKDTQGVKGLGLGLSIVRDLVAAHRGVVWAESAGPGSGSTFRVRLPIVDADRSPVSAKKAS